MLLVFLATDLRASLKRLEAVESAFTSSVLVLDTGIRGRVVAVTSLEAGTRTRISGR